MAHKDRPARLKKEHKKMIELQVKNQMTNIDSYRSVYNRKGKTTKAMKNTCDQIMARPDVRAYKKELEKLIVAKLERKEMERVAEKAVWNREIATQTLLNLKNEAEKEIKEGAGKRPCPTCHGEGKVKVLGDGNLPELKTCWLCEGTGKVLRRQPGLDMVRVAAIEGSAKELNNLHGLSNPTTLTFAPKVIFGDDAESKIKE